MKKQLTLKKLSLFVLTALLFVLLSLAFAFTGTARAFADGEGQPCPDGQHSLGKVFVIEKQTCVSHGVGVRYCDKCGLSFNVVIPADGISHKVDKDGKCSECGTTNVHYVITENLPDNDYVEVGQVQESEVTEITIPATVTTKGEVKDVHIAEGAFEGNETIQSVTILGTPEIGAEAFKDCKNLTNVTMEAGTQNIAADAFVGTPFYENKLEEAKNAENQDELQPISISINGGIGSYLLKVVDPTAIKAGSSGGSAEPEPEVRPRRNAAALAEEAEAPKTFTYTVAGGTQVIAEKAFEGLANLVEVTLNADLLTVGANAFDGCSGLKTIYIAENAAETSFANVAGLAPFNLAPFNTIYYRGGFAEKLFSQLADVIRYFSAAEPTDNAHTYWHFVEADGVELPTIWNKAVEIELDTSKCTTRFRKGEPFSSENLVVKVRYENETQLKEVTENIDVDSTEYKADELGEYTITVSYLTYLKTTYTVKVDNAYTITINYGYDGMPSETELVFVSEGFPLPAAPSRTGYKFLGWKVGEEEELRGAGEKITPTADVTVTAQWEQLYRVTAQAANATTGLSETRYYQDGTTVTFTVTPDNGYKLVSVKNGDNTLTAQDGKYSVTVNKADIVITVETTAVTVTATAKEGTVAKDQNGDTATFTLTPPTKSGFRFDGWTVKIDNAEPVDVEGNIYTLKLANADVKVEFAAKWTEMLLTEASATLQLNGNTLTFIATVKGNGFDLETIKDVKLQLGAENPIIGTAAAATDGFTLTYTLTDLTAKEYTLKFVLGTKDVYANKTISGTVTLTNTENTLRYALANGKLTVTEPLTVTFVVEHGTNLTRSVFAGDTLDLDEIEPAPVEGYVFLYWYTTDEEGTETKQSGEITVNSAMTINAKMGDEVTASVSIADYATANSWANSGVTGVTDKYYTVELNNHITVTASGSGNTGKYYESNFSWRIYEFGDGRIQIAAPEDGRMVKIKSIQITYDNSNNGRLYYGSKQYDTGTILDEIYAPSIELTVGHSSGNDNGNVQIKQIIVTYGVVLTDQEKIDMALESVSSTYTVGESGDYPLPESPFADVAFTWEVLTENSPYGIVNGDHLDIKELPHDTDKQIQLKLTASYNSVEVSKTITVTVKKQIKLAATEFETTPFSELKAKVATSGQTTTEKFYAIGAVKSASSEYNSEIYITNEENEDLYVYGILTEDGTQTIDCSNGVTAFNIGDTIVVYGQMTNYKGTIEMQYAWLVQVNTDAKTNPAKVVLDGITVPDTVSENFELPTVNDTVTWSVASGEGITVSGNQATVTRTADEQTVVLKATTTVGSFTENKEFTVKVQRYVEGLEEIVVTADTLLSGVSGYKNNGTATIGGYGFSWIGMGNYNLLQMRTNSSTGTSSFWNTAAFQYDIIKVTFEWASGKTLLTKADALKVEFSNSVEFEEGATTSKTITFEENTYELTVEGSYKFVRITHNCSNTVYLDKVTIACQDSTEPKPVEPRNIEQVGEIDFYGANFFKLAVSDSDLGFIKTSVASVKVDGVQYPHNSGAGFLIDGSLIQIQTADNARESDVTTFELEWYNEAGELVAKTTVTRKIVEKLVYSVTEVALIGAEDTLGIMITIDAEAPADAKVELTIGGRAVAATLEGDTITCDNILPVAIGNSVTIALKINGSEPTAWAGVITDPESVGTVNYTLAVSDGKLTVKAESTVPVEKTVTGFHDSEIWSDNPDNPNAVTVNFWVDTTGYTADDLRAAKLLVNGQELSTRASSEYMIGNGSQSKLWFELMTLSDVEGALLQLKIGEKTYDVNVTAGRGVGSKTMNDRTYTLEAEGDQLKLTVKTNKPEPEFSYSVREVTYSCDDEKTLTIMIGLNITGTAKGQAVLTVNGVEAKADVDDMPIFKFTPNGWNGTLVVELVIDGKKADWTDVEVTDEAVTIGDYSYTLAVEGSELKLTVVNESQKKVDAAVETLKPQLENKELTEDLQLPTVEGVTIKWSVEVTTPDADQSAASIEGNTTLKIKRSAADVQIQLTGAITCGNAGTATLQVTLTIKAEEAPEKIETIYTLNMPKQEYVSGGTQGSYADAYDVAVDNVTWSAELNTTLSGGWGFGGKSVTKVDRKLTSKNAILGKVTEIKVSFGTKDSGITVNSVTLKVYNDNPSNGGQEIDSKNISFAASSTKTVTAEKEWKDCYYEFIFNVTVSGNKNQKVMLTKIVFDGVKPAGGGTEPGGGGQTEPGAQESTLYTLAQTIMADKSSEATYNGYATYCNVECGDVTWNVCGNVTQSGGWRFGGKGGSKASSTATYDREISSTTAIAGKVTKISFALGAIKNGSSSTITINSVILKVYDVAPNISSDSSAPTYSSQAIYTSESFSYTENTVCTVNAPTDADWTNKYYQLVINITLKGKNNSYVVINSMEYTGYPASSDQGMEGPSMTAFTANMNNGNVESNGLWIALAVGGSALIALSALAVVVLLRKHN